MAGGTTHQVQRGDTLIRIAQRYGFRSIEPIWEHEGNAELRAKRPNPFLIAQGDKVFIPDKEMDEHACVTNRRHVFRMKPLTQWLDQIVLDAENEPLAGKRYRLQAGNKKFEGTTDSEGRIRVEIPLEAKTGELTIWPGDEVGQQPVTWQIKLGHLEPVETVYGLTGHLTNLGYDCGGPSEQLNDKARAALREFQRDNGLPESGEADQPTLARLREIFRYPVGA